MANTQVNWKAVNAELDYVRAELEPLNVSAEKCGNWIWISGNTRRYSQKLRALRCEFSKEKGMWFFIPPSLPKREQSSERRSIEEIRRYHGSKAFQRAQASQKKASSKSSQASPFSVWEVISKFFMLYTTVYR